MDYLTSAELKIHAQGRWGYIISALAPSLSYYVDQRPGKHFDCPHPAHGGKRDFRLHKDFEDTGGAICTCNKRMGDGFAVLMWINGWDFITTFNEVASLLGIEVRKNEGSPKSNIDWEEVRRKKEAKAKKEAENNAKLREILSSIWKGTVPANHYKAEPLRLYLARRGLSTQHIPNTLRFMPSLVYRDDDGNIVDRFPAIIALVQDINGNPVTLHRIYLTKDGQKANVTEPKKMMPYPSDTNVNGCAIRLAPAGQALGITEGVETGLAVQQSTGMPVWATISATLMESLKVPDEVEIACIYADLDRSETGENSAQVLVEKLSQKGQFGVGLLPSMAIPSAEKGIDWMDVFNKYGPDKIPNLSRIYDLIKGA